MTVSVSSAFDGGNGDVVDASAPDAITVRIQKDAKADFMQWFYFRVAGLGGAPAVVRLINAGEASYGAGYEGYSAVASTDRERWYRVPTSYADGVLEIRHPGGANAVWLAYFVPFSMERHHDLIGRASRDPRVRHEVLGRTVDGQDLDALHVGEGPLSIWCIARQHPGETMAEHWMEGFLARLLDPDEPVARALLAKATFHVVPNMNPDGSRRGHLRTNAAGANLNREWAEPSLERSPEVFLVREQMIATGVDLCLDVHGDEELPYNFIAGPDGVPSLTAAQRELLARFRAELRRRSPDFQTERGYPPAAPGQANLRLCTNWVAERFGCLSMTLEMPFKDNADLPIPETGWSPARCAHLAEACLDTIAAVAEELRVGLGSRR
ncbi:MAG: carboxypeptidase family protein [Sandaracinaceae bacterium]|nr:carboxypeptidase family protein [Sandaracinaceae bacterium]